MAEACPNCGALKNWMEDIQRCMACGYMGDPETARLREAVAELAKATEQGLKWMRKRRDMCLDGEVSLGLIALADDIDTADCALKDHAPLIAECKAEKEG